MYDVKKFRETNDSNEIIRYFMITAGKHILAAALGFAVDFAAVQGLTPFGTALAAGIFPEYIPAAVLGSAAGYFTTYGITVLTLRYIASSSIAGICSYLLKRSLKRQYHRHFSALSGFFAIFSTGLIMSMSIALSIDEIVLYLAEGAMAGAAAYFTDVCININPMKKYAARLSGSETAGVLVLFSIFLAALRFFDMSLVSPAVIAGVYVVLTAGSYGGEKYGALTGICAGVVLGYSSDVTFVTGGIALGGLLCGIFGRKNRFISSIICVLTVCIMAFSAEELTSTYAVILSTLSGAVLFMASPKKLRKKFTEIFSLSDGGVFLSGQRRVLKSRLDIASAAMTEVSSSVKAIAGIYRRRTTPKKENIYENTCNKVCRSCSQYDFCWNKNYGVTYGWFTSISDSLRKNDSPSEKDIPYRFFASCLEPEKVMNAMSRQLSGYRMAMRETVKTGETVNIVSDQFGSVSELLKKFSSTMETAEEYDPEKSELVRGVVENDFGMSTRSVGVFVGETDRFFAEICFAPVTGKTDFDNIANGISDVLDVSFEKPVITTLPDGATHFLVCEKTKYNINFGGFQINSEDGRWCGDTFDSFYDGKGRFIAILSDGMGTGKKAAADSVLCCSLSSTLLKSGFPVDSIINVVNSAMLVRSGEESLATLDISVVNLYTGDVTFYKAGASFSLVMKHLKLLKAEKPSLPVGILREVKFEKAEISLRDGDRIVMMSDGVTPEAVSVWREILKSAPDCGEKELADKLAKTAVMNSGKDKADDITVLSMSIETKEIDN